MARQVLCCHSEGKGFQLNFFLPASECFVNETVNLVHRIIRHGVTADRFAAAMHHKKGAGSPERAIKGIGKTNIKGEISTRHWVHLVWSNVIKSFRRLVIPFEDLRPEMS